MHNPDRSLPYPYLIFVADLADPRFAKTAFGVRDWSPEKCVGEFACSEDAVRTGLPRMSPRAAAERGARSMLVGVANQGGYISAAWVPSLLEALEAGLDLVCGLHTRLGSIPELVDAAKLHNRKLIDIRVPPSDIPVGTGRKRPGKRLLTVGTDCALGKKYTALVLVREFARRGLPVDFRATGQTGIMIAGCGIPMDAVVSDFEAGAAELLSPDADPEHWDVIEGQGSLFHPAYAAVSMGLLHGSQPDVIVMCHQPGRSTMAGTANYRLPGIEEAIELNLRVGSRTNPNIRCAGVSLNTAHMTDAEAADYLTAEEERLEIPVTDPVRGGASLDRLVDACLA